MTDTVAAALHADPVLRHTIDLLPSWLPDQRWFAGIQPPPARDIRVAEVTTLRDDDPRAWLLLIEVSHHERRELYQVAMSVHDDADQRLEHVRIGTIDDVDGHTCHVYDGLHDKAVTAEILHLFDGVERDGHHHGFLRIHREPDVTIPSHEPSMVLPVEQSNTSLAFGDVALLKVFRRIRPGRNPDVEIHDALTRSGSDQIAALLGWIDGQWTHADGESAQGDLAMLQTYLTTASDGWALAAASVRDLYAEGDLHADEVGGDFAGESERLGMATAMVHRSMAETLATSTFSVSDLDTLADHMIRRLDAAVESVPELLPYADGLRSRLDAVRTVTSPVPVQRVHGDYHLGQVLRTVDGWKLVDFEGEPGKPIVERAALDSPLRDIAGMLRSFDYAARHQLVNDHTSDDLGYEMITYRATEWAERNRTAFCDGYAAEAAFDPREYDVLLDAYETDKAIYEVVYESHHRPSWISIPLAAAERLAQS